MKDKIKYYLKDSLIQWIGENRDDKISLGLGYLGIILLFLSMI